MRISPEQLASIGLAALLALTGCAPTLKLDTKRMLIQRGLLRVLQALPIEER
jgi:hypothetical protein